MLTPVAAVAVLAACSDSTSNSNPLPQADVSIVSGASLLTNTAYNPDTITVALNGGSAVTVVWRNDDVGILHHVTDTTVAAAFDVAVTTGDTSSVTFNGAGEFPYKCSIHPGMRGLVVVTP